LVRAPSLKHDGMLPAFPVLWQLEPRKHPLQCVVELEQLRDPILSVPRLPPRVAPSGITLPLRTIAYGPPPELESHFGTLVPSSYVKLWGEWVSRTHNHCVPTSGTGRATVITRLIVLSRSGIGGWPHTTCPEVQWHPTPERGVRGGHEGFLARGGLATRSAIPQPHRSRKLGALPRLRAKRCCVSCIVCKGRVRTRL
jgi:hypothetical protein